MRHVFSQQRPGPTRSKVQLLTPPMAMEGHTGEGDSAYDGGGFPPIAFDSSNAQEARLSGRPEAGAAVFRKCVACHQVGPNARNGIGPVLNGVVGRPAGRYPGYNYSSANKNSGLVWDERTLARYLRAPAEVVPSTKMIFFGLEKDQDILDVIAYLNQFAADVKHAHR